MEIHAKHAVCASSCDDVCDKFCCDRNPTLVFSILPGIAEVGDDGGDLPGGSTLECVDLDHQLHEVVIDGHCG